METIITSIYGHLSEIDVTEVQEVDIGRLIGKEGETGWATGPHVHLQINVWGIPVNPRIFLGDGDPEDIVITQSFSQPAGFINDDLVYFGHKT